MTLQEAHHQLLSRLYQVYDQREAANIADRVIEHISGLKKIDRIVHKSSPFSIDKEVLLQKYTDELLVHKPVQYVLHEAWFYGLPFFVDESVLIPRPETEELVELAGSREPEAGSREPNTKTIFDIGTGSGCIPIVLKKKLPGYTVYSCDVSEKALEVARKNAATHQTDIHFLQLDFLNTANWDRLPEVDIIVSNPPYVPQQDKATMQDNVLRYEPHLALFVENDDPLLFYKAIADFALQKLLPGGWIFTEIHEELGQQAQELFTEKGFNQVDIKKDMQGKERMIRCRK